MQIRLVCGSFKAAIKKKNYAYIKNKCVAKLLSFQYWNCKKWYKTQNFELKAIVCAV